MGKTITNSMLDGPRGQGIDGNTFFKQLNIITAVFIPLPFSFMLEIYIYLPPMSSDSFDNFLLLFESRAAFLGNTFVPVTLVPPTKTKRSKSFCSTNYLDNWVEEKLKGGSPFLVSVSIRKDDGFPLEHTPCLRAFRKSKTKQRQHGINTAESYLWFVLAVAKSVTNCITLYATQWQVVL